MIRPFLAALSFLSRIPFIIRFTRSEDYGKIVDYFAPAGLCIGLIQGFILLIASQGNGPLIAAALAIGFGLLLTGAFHEDGLADVCDALGKMDIDTRLRIMRDSRIGAFGASALGFALLWRYGCYAEIIQSKEGWHIIAALALAGGWSRFSSCILLYWPAYLKERPDKAGVGESMLATNKLTMLIQASCLIILTAFIFKGSAIVAICLCGVIILAAALFFKRWINGVSGDCLGATNVIVELTFLSAL